MRNDHRKGEGNEDTENDNKKSNDKADLTLLRVIASVVPILSVRMFGPVTLTPFNNIPSQFLVDSEALASSLRTQGKCLSFRYGTHLHRFSHNTVLLD